MVKALDGTPDALYSDRFEEDAGAQLQDTLSEFGYVRASDPPLWPSAMGTDG
ncbi:TPA: hypothetical protein J1X24_002646 [Escherichia coli]|nr:hypothetical protein [Escherichia coli]EID6494407.1 hypothetical protein [Escherichia coli]HBA7105366.1 hypothetical protein [Escherichia coli]HBA7590337.1 hypothetical protein [Escherichia coli]HBA7870602.1 hypothetical protein [Escherichia coli]